MTNKTFKCPKCGGSEYKQTSMTGLRVCDTAKCPMSWWAADDLLYLKDAEPEIVRCEIKPTASYLEYHHNGVAHCLYSAIGYRGFSGFEFEDGSVSLESPWAWKTKDGKLQLFHNFLPADCVANFTPVLAKFVRVKGAE